MGQIPLQPGVSVLIGLQWGDEGKGKWIDHLAQQADLVVRYQGGNNAGHSIQLDNGEQHVFHLLPSGVFHPHCLNILSAGVVINPEVLWSEIQILPNFDWQKSLKISNKSHLITPWDIQFDHILENHREKQIGTTKRGIGPTYADKTQRQGLRFWQALIPEQLQHYADTKKEQLSPWISDIETLQRLDTDWEAFCRNCEKLRSIVCDAESLIRQAAVDGKKVLAEGAQGTLLDINLGHYPFVTSSSTLAQNFYASTGVPTKYHRSVIGIAKIYATRVGEGPFPTEQDNETGQLLRKKGGEFGATTGRPRRCGWLDLPALKYACDINGVDRLIINKIDVLDGFENIEVATKITDESQAAQQPSLYWPDQSLGQQNWSVSYQKFKGWNTLGSPTSWQELPQDTLKLLNFIEDFCKVTICAVGVGKKRSDAVFK